MDPWGFVQRLGSFLYFNAVCSTITSRCTKFSTAAAVSRGLCATNWVYNCSKHMFLSDAAKFLQTGEGQRCKDRFTSLLWTFTLVTTSEGRAGGGNRGIGPHQWASFSWGVFGAEGQERLYQLSRRNKCVFSHFLWRTWSLSTYIYIYIYKCLHSKEND